MSRTSLAIAATLALSLLAAACGPQANSQGAKSPSTPSFPDQAERR